MKVLILDIEGEATALDLALRSQAAGHEVQYWQPKHATGVSLPYGEGLVSRPDEWEPDGQDLIVVNGNSRYHARLSELLAAGYPVFGFSEGAAELELDRAVGQKVLEDHGIETLPYTVVGSAEEGIQHIAAEGRPYVMKPWAARPTRL